jgi:hypothetical protein
MRTLFGRIADSLESISTELRELRKIEVTRLLLNEIGSDTVRQARFEVIYEMDLTAVAPKDIAEKDRKKALLVAVSFDRVGYLIVNQLIPEDLSVYELQKDEISVCWEKLKPLVISIRDGPPPRANYCHHFQQLATDWLK